jgi:hypothetical protein
MKIPTYQTEPRGLACTRRCSATRGRRRRGSSRPGRNSPPSGPALASSATPCSPTASKVSFIRDTVLPYSIKSYYHKLSSSLPIKRCSLIWRRHIKKQSKKQKTFVKYIPVILFRKTLSCVVGILPISFTVPFSS